MDRVPDAVLEFAVGDLAEFEPQQPHDLAAALGATVGRYDEMLARLASLVRRALRSGQPVGARRGDFLDWIRNGARRYVELGGRETLGFGLFLFVRV